MRYVRHIEDTYGDVVDVEVYCSAQCWTDAGLGDPFGHAYPAPERADYAQCCPHCGRVAIVAIGEDGFDGWPVDVPGDGLDEPWPGYDINVAAGLPPDHPS